MTYDQFRRHFTHEDAADLFMGSRVGQGTGISRTDFLQRLRGKYPDEASLNAMIAAFLTAASARPERSYALGPDGSFILCRRCTRTSHNAQDVAQRYCSFCRKFHKET